MGTEYKQGQIVDDNKVRDLFEARSSMNGINTVMSCAEDPETIRQNQYRDYITKESLLKYLRVNKTDELFDFGCGVGRIVQSVAGKVKSVYAVDVSAGMIAKAKNANQYSNVEFDVASSDSDFGKNRFTKIYTCWVLQHVSDKEIGSYLDKFYKALKSGGRMVILEQVRLNQSRQSEYMIQRMEDDYKKLFEISGFNFIESHKVFRVPSYAMDIWKKYKLPKMFLPMLGFIEKITVMRKPEYIEYVSAVMVFEKMHK